MSHPFDSDRSAADYAREAWDDSPAGVYSREVNEADRHRSYCLWCGEPIGHGEEFCPSADDVCRNNFQLSVEADRLELDAQGWPNDGR